MARQKRTASRPDLRLVPGGRRSEPPTGPSDDELCDAVAQGDGATSALLYDRLIDVVDGTLCRIVGRREDDHDDLVQTSFEQILLSLMRGRFQRRCSLTSWAARIATHVGFNALRARQRQRKVVDRSRDPGPSIERAPSGSSAERQLEARRELERVRLHLGALDERKATAVFLHDALGYDLGEVAELTGVTVSAAQSRLVRGRRELHRRLAHEPADPERKEQP